MSGITSGIRNRVFGRVPHGEEVYSDQDRFYALLGLRLHLKPGDKWPFPHISLFVSASCAYVFVVAGKNNDPVVITEMHPELFPSDETVAKLRMLMA